jgi:tetratricopeptide (TPR) repeat protein
MAEKRVVTGLATGIANSLRLPKRALTSLFIGSLTAFAPLSFSFAADNDSPAPAKGGGQAGKQNYAPASPVPDKFIHFNGKLPKVTQIDSGPGLVVCEPVCNDAQGDLPEMSRGCAAWLQFAVAGQPQFGKTPFWRSIRRVQQQLKRQDLRFEDPKEAGKLAVSLGATHILLGRINGDAKKCTLNYQIYQVSNMSAMGEQLTITGTQTELRNQLPKLAALICRILQIKPEHLPSAAPAIPELVLIGQVQARQNETATEKLRAALRQLHSSSAIANFLYLDTATPHDPLLKETLDTLITQESSNAIVIGEVGWLEGKVLKFYSKRMENCFSTHPKNYLFKTSAVYYYRALGNNKQALETAKECVQLAPLNPDAWLTLAQSYNQAADTIRDGRFKGAMTDAERRELDAIYPLWLGAAERAVLIDPLFGKAWLRVSTAAAYAGFMDEADRAFEQAITQERERYNTYVWGLQLYQAKWCNKPAKLERLAMTAAKDQSLSEGEKKQLALSVQLLPEIVKILSGRGTLTDAKKGSHI